MVNGEWDLWGVVCWLLFPAYYCIVDAGHDRDASSLEWPRDEKRPEIKYPMLGQPHLLTFFYSELVREENTSISATKAHIPKKFRSI